MLLALELVQVLAVEHENAVDPVQGEGIRLAGDLHEQGTDDRHGDRQLEHEPRPLAGPAGDPDRAPHRVHHALDHVEPDAPAGDLGDLFLGREAGQEEEVEQLGLAEPAAIAAVVSPRSTTLARSRSRSMPRPSSLRMICSIPARWRASRRIGPHRRLAGRAAVLGHLEAVVQRVADQVVERRLEPVEDVAVDAGGLADDLEPRLLAELAGQVADQRGKPRTPSASGRIRLASTSWCSRLERSSLTRANSSIASTVSPSRCKSWAACALALASSSRSAAVSASPWLDTRSSRMLQRFQESGLSPLEPPERVDQRRQPMGLHQGLTRQAHQPRQALGRHPHDAVAFSVAVRGWPALPLVASWP